MAAGTGFRANELRSLTPESFDLAADPPTVTVEAAYSKRRRDDIQPIRPDLAAALRSWIAGKAPGRPVFGNLTKHTVKLIRHDWRPPGCPTAMPRAGWPISTRCGTPTSRRWP